MSGNEIRNSKEIQEFYGHPADGEGQGVYMMLEVKGKVHWCPSGNELSRWHELEPTRWLTGPIFVPLSKEDHERFAKEFRRKVDRF